VLFLIVLVGPVSAAPTAITEYPVDVGHETDIEDAMVAADGSLWFDDHYWPEGQYHSLIGHMTPTGQVQEFDHGLGRFSSVKGLTQGPDGEIWFTDDRSAFEGSAVGTIDPTGAITEYPVGPGTDPVTIGPGPDGAMWFTAIGEAPAIGEVAPGGPAATYVLPERPWNAVEGPDGNLWFTYGGEYEDGAIGRLEPHGDGGVVVTLFTTGLRATSKPGEILEADGYLWFVDYDEEGQAIGRVSPSGQITEFSAGLQPDTYIRDMAVGPEGDVWFADDGAGEVGRISPDGQIAEFTDDSLRPNWGLRWIAAGPEGDMWFTYAGGQAGIGKVTASGQVTMIHDGHDGLAADSYPGEIVSGHGGELWFVNRLADESQTIARIVPGDDTEPGPPATGRPPGGPAQPSKASPARVTVISGRIVNADRSGRVRVRLSCQNTGVACEGRVGLTFFLRTSGGRRHVASAAYFLPPGASKTLPLKVDRLGNKLLSTGRRQRARLTITGTAGVSMGSTRLTVVPPPRRRGHRPIPRRSRVDGAPGATNSP
jgi:streptogramin lyase